MAATQPDFRDLDSPTDKMPEKTTSPTADDLFAGLTIEDKDKDKKKIPPQRPPPMNRPDGENKAPPGRRGPPPPHRPSRSQEEALRARRQRPSGDGPNSPPRRTVPPRPRRNSDSSLAERPMTDEEKKARERRRRERDDRKRREGGREGRDSKGKPRSHRDMDLIDKLDATSIYGTGIFHHAGPYDAVIASRNTAGKRPSPMEAFAKDSANMSMGGSGPLNSRADHATFMGVATDEAFTDYAAGMPGSQGTKQDLALFDPHRRASVIYGDITEGLGTTTFLEGTPAAKAAVQKAEQENAMLGVEGGLQRKKSLAQRIRGINRPPRSEFPPPSGRLTNPDGAYRDHASSVSMSSSRAESNPFFAEYEPSKDGEDQITVRETGRRGSGTPPLPGSLERRATTDALGGPESKKSGGGLLGRMKSLKGGPRRPSDKYNGEAA
ncbi:Protein PAL1 [Cytospora mali]|uniref:Protein PAL1 n=1 Tax=Cytospora mali TaxID=578113 RepID=A0A194UWJ2_CYTMA|nr:Protein PAL1 [Valsa mali var. pyri (nom. inval.)]